MRRAILRNRDKITSATGAEFLFIFSLLSSWHLQANEEISFTTHFFAEPEQPGTLTANTDQQIPAMQMVIFNAEPEQIKPQPEYQADTSQAPTLVYYLDSSYQQDDVSWSVAGPNNFPDTLTEVNWKKIDLIGFQAGLSIPLPLNMLFKADGQYAWTVSGRNSQQFFLNNSKTQLFSNTDYDADHGSSWFGSVALGYAFNLGSPPTDTLAVQFTPLAGFSWREKNLSAQNGQQQLDNFEAVNRDGDNQQNSYRARWYGPWVGADLSVSAFQQHQLFSSFQHHWAEFKADGHWRQNNDLQQPISFQHKADADGIVASAGYRYLTRQLWGIRLSVDYEKWDSQSGEEKLFTRNNNQIQSRFNGIQRESVGINLGLSMQF